MQQVYDYVIIGSGMGGSVSAMRLTEKGYSVIVLEKGKRFEDKDFAKSNWQNMQCQKSLQNVENYRST